MIRFPFTGRVGMALATFLAGLCLATPAVAQVAGIPALNINEGANGSTYSLSLQILALMTALTLLPSLVLGMTSFTRIIIVLSILRQAMGTQQTPPNQVLVAIALFLTFFIMAPTFTTLNTDVISPYLDGQLPAETALANGTEVMKRFLVQNTRVNDLIMFTEMVGDQPYASAEEVPLNVLLPAFITSELKTAFQIGFLLFLPFLVIDIAVATILMAMGMIMVPPVMIALPFKLAFFTVSDGWELLAAAMVRSYGG